MIEKTGLPLRVVHESTNGIEALDWMRKNEADLIITDIRMPVMDGLALIEQLCSEEIQTDVMIVSGYDDFQYAQKALRFGVVDYLLKPVELEDARSRLSDWMGSLEQKERDERKYYQEKHASDMSPVDQVMRFVKESMPGDVSLAEAAEKVHLNPCYLSQLFKQQTQKNFVDFVTETRMKEAQKLLVYTSMRVSEIAYRLGYTDLSYFSHTFKKFTGTPPSEYRKASKETDRKDGSAIG